jgi:hypothetical protein
MSLPVLGQAQGAGGDVNYTYRGEGIPKKQFEVMYGYFKTYFGMRASDGKLFDCRRPKSNSFSLAMPNSGAGEGVVVQGKIAMLYAEGVALTAKDEDGDHFIAYLHFGISPEGLVMGREIAAMTFRNGSFSPAPGYAYPRFDWLSEPNQYVFWKWLGNGNKLYHLVYREDKDRNLCEDCGGEGKVVQVKTDDPLRRTLADCRTCGGDGIIVTKERNTKWTWRWRPDDEHK